jgi:hypothetical protein
MQYGRQDMKDIDPDKPERRVFKTGEGKVPDGIRPSSNPKLDSSAGL